MKNTAILIIFLSLFLLACQPQTHFVKSETKYIKLETLKDSDKEIVAMIAPYKKDLEKEMNEVIGSTAKMLTLGQPESTLGNWAADVVFEKVEAYLGTKIDFCMLNLGGLRIPSLPKGDITAGKVFELMPFDNILVAVEMKGEDLQALFDRAAAAGGWPISKQLSMVIYKDKAQDVLIDGKKIKTNQIYKVAMNDYMANGGDKCFFLKDKKKISTDKLMRNSFMDYIKEETKKGKKIDVEIENRVYYLK